MTYTFQDILKSSFLEKITTFSALDMVLALGMSFALGLFIYLVYKKSFNGVMYSANFGLSLIAISMITSIVILTISSNVILSLGMVGALSIVRFRTAIKEPMDIVFLFWSIAIGIVNGAGLIPLAVFGSLAIGLVLMVFANHKTTDTPFILVVSCETDEIEKDILAHIDANAKNYALKSKSLMKNQLELTYEVRLKDAASQFVNQISDLPGVSHAVLVSYNGEYMS